MNAVASMPFKLMKGTKEYDASADWENKVGFLPNPTYILQMVEAALVMCGRAYLFRERSAVATKALRYHLPTSVTPVIDGVKGLVAFKRPVNNVERTFKVEDYVYFWLPDPFVEIGPPLNYPAQAAANASGVLLNLDTFASNFFERGALKVTLLSVKGIPKESDRQKLEDWWKNVVGGVKKAFGAKVFNAEAVTPVVIGEGMKELENVNIQKDKREDVAVALGIPMSILFANAANYATSQQDELNFLTKTVIPDCEFIAAVLNEQLFEPLGLHMDFMPETLDAMQEDEAARAAALGQLTGAGIPLLMAMDLLGFELTDEQRIELELAVIEKKERAEQMVQQLQGKKPEDGKEEDEEDDAEDEEDDQEAQKDLDRWQRKSLNSLRRGKAAAVPFDSDSIPVQERQRITLELLSATTADDVKHIFGGNGEPSAKSIQELTAALSAVALAMREHEQPE
jgi:HK97 family phage portal protein